jgi:predicted NBD/HSP70 family sugar kinase
VAVQSVLDPEVVIFGGGIGSREDFVDRVRADVPLLTRRPPVLAASALGERAGAVGAAELALASVAERGADERLLGAADA